MIRLFTIIAIISSFSAFAYDASELLNYLPEGSYQGTSDDGKCFVRAESSDMVGATVTISNVPFGQGQPADKIIFFNNLLSNELVKKDIGNDYFEMIVQSEPTNDYTRPLRSTLEIVKKSSSTSTVTIFNKSRFLGMWMKEGKMSCEIDL